MTQKWDKRVAVLALPITHHLSLGESSDLGGPRQALVPDRCSARGGVYLYPWLSAMLSQLRGGQAGQGP